MQAYSICLLSPGHCASWLAWLFPHTADRSGTISVIVFVLTQQSRASHECTQSFVFILSLASVVVQFIADPCAQLFDSASSQQLLDHNRLCCSHAMSTSDDLLLKSRIEDLLWVVAQRGFRIPERVRYRSAHETYKIKYKNAHLIQ